MNMAAWQLSKTTAETGISHQPRQAFSGIESDGSRHRIARYFKFSKWLVVVAITIELRRREVAILIIVVIERLGERLGMGSTHATLATETP